MKDDPKLVSASQLADILGISPTDVSNYVKEGMPRIAGINQKAHRFHLDECTKWVYEWRNKQHTIRQDTLRDAQIRKLNLESDRIQLELAEKRKELIAVEKISAIWGDLMVALKIRMMAIPKRLSALYDSFQDRNELESAASELVNEALSEMSQHDNLIERSIEDK